MVAIPLSTWIMTALIAGVIAGFAKGMNDD